LILDFSNHFKSGVQEEGRRRKKKEEEGRRI
jgi:hypothetical protein